MASWCKIMVIVVILMVTLSQCSVITDYFYNGSVTCYPTLQKCILETIQPYVYGLSCESEYVGPDTGILPGIQRFVLKLWRFVIHSEEDMYACELNWHITSFRFSVKNHWCMKGRVQDTWISRNLFWVIIAAIIWIVVCGFLLGYHKETSGGHDDNENQDHKHKDGKIFNRSRFNHRRRKYPEDLRYNLLKKTYERNLARAGINDNLQKNQSLIQYAEMKGKEKNEGSQSKGEELKPKPNIKQMKQKTKESLNWILDQSIKHVKKIGDYTILKMIGCGSFGRIYLAKNEDRLYLSKKLPPLARKEDYVAMKMVDKQFLTQCRDHQNWKQAARNELKIMLKSVCCPFLMYTIDAFQTFDYLVYVMPLMFGTLLGYKPALSSRKLALVAAEILNGLSHLHSLGFIHRDLKLDNILIGENGHLKISDFGCAQENVYGRKKAYGIIGSRRYRAPEVHQGKPYNETSDFWSLGVILYLLREKAFPFQDIMDEVQDFALIVKHLLFQRASDEEIQFIRGLFHHDPDQRLGSLCSQSGDIYAHSYFSGIDCNKLWDGVYEAPCQVMGSPMEALDRCASAFVGIPVRPGDDVEDQDLEDYADFTVLCI